MKYWLMKNKNVSPSSTPKTCPVCKQPADDLISGVSQGQYISDRCQSCWADAKTSALYARQYDRQWQRRHYAKDIIQPFEKEAFIKNYPKQAKEIYSEEDFHKYG